MFEGCGCYTARVKRRTFRAGLTLLELLIVLVVIAVLAGLVVPILTHHGDRSRTTATEASLSELRDVITQYWRDFDKSLPQSGGSSPQTLYLFVNPDTYGDGNPATTDQDQTYDPHYKLGWRGPYVSQATGTYSESIADGFDSTYGTDGEPALIDAWGQPIVIQLPTPTTPGLTIVRLLSAGPNGILDTSYTAAETQGDDIDVTFELR